MENLVPGVGTGRRHWAHGVESVKWASLPTAGRGDDATASLMLGVCMACEFHLSCLWLPLKAGYMASSLLGV